MAKKEDVRELARSVLADQLRAAHEDGRNGVVLRTDHYLSNAGIAINAWAAAVTLDKLDEARRAWKTLADEYERAARMQAEDA